MMSDYLIHFKIFLYANIKLYRIKLNYTVIYSRFYHLNIKLRAFGINIEIQTPFSSTFGPSQI